MPAVTHAKVNSHLSVGDPKIRLHLRWPRAAPWQRPALFIPRNTDPLHAASPPLPQPLRQFLPASMTLTLESPRLIRRLCSALNCVLKKCLGMLPRLCKGHLVPRDIMNIKLIMQNEIIWTHEGQMSLYASQSHQIQTEIRWGPPRSWGESRDLA